MNTFTYEELLIINRIVAREGYKIRKRMKNKIWRTTAGIFRPEELKKQQILDEIERKIADLEVQYIEEKKKAGNKND